MIKTAILGIVQGLTEFLPISSSGHLAILENLLHVQEPMTLAVFLHFGTLLAIIVFFCKPIIDLLKGIVTGDKKRILYLLMIVVGTIPIVVAGILVRSWVTNAFANLTAVSISLGITGMIVLLTGIVKKQDKVLNMRTALLIGLAQMFSLLPGISRSGMTISTGLFSGTAPERAFRFSFLLSIPAVLGANIYEMKNISMIGNIQEILVGMACSFIAGLVALRVLRSMVQKRFYLFGPYCLIISIITLLLLG